MDTRTSLIASALLAASLLSGAAHAALYDRGGGLIYDDVLNITWLQDANQAKTSGYDTDGRMNWADAKAWVDGLTYGGFSDWRLPTLGPVNGTNFQYFSSSDYWSGNRDMSYNITSPNSELAYNFYVNLQNRGYLNKLGNTEGGYGLTNSGPFINVQNDWYWFGLEAYPNPRSGWEFAVVDGYQGWGLKETTEFAWAVRDGDVAAIPEPETYAMLLAGLGLVGEAVRRRRG